MRPQMLRMHLCLRTATAQNKGQRQKDGFCFPNFDRPIAEKSTMTCNNSPTQIAIKNNQHKFVRVQPAALEFASMDGTDVAIYRLRETYGELARRGIQHPFVVSDRTDDVGNNETLKVSSALHNTNYVCDVDKNKADVVEDSYHWPTSIKMKHSQSCNIIPGVSGSPLYRETFGVKTNCGCDEYVFGCTHRHSSSGLNESPCGQK
jgi:hypothetical protein